MYSNVQRLRIFLAVADALHFGRAAERLRISQPSVSQQVARLERELGCRLFDRESSGVALTAAGRELVGSVGTALRGLDKAVEDFVHEHRERRRLQVGLLSSMAGALVPAAISLLEWEGVEVGLTEGSLALLAERLRRAELDVAFCYGTGEPNVLAGLQIETLDRRPVVVAMPADDVLAAGSELAWAELAARPWIMPSASRQYRDDMIDRFQSRGLAIRVVAEATTLVGQLALVAAGIGLTLTSPWAIVPAGVTTRPVAAPTEEIELLAVCPTGAGSVVGKALVDAVRDQARAAR